MSTKNAIDPKYLRRLRKKEGKTLKVWGSLFGVSLNTAYRWEAGLQTIPESVPIILGLRRQIKELEKMLFQLNHPNLIDSAKFNNEHDSHIRRKP